MSASSGNNGIPKRTTEEKGKWVATGNNNQINDRQEAKGS